jgi:hypothetical protein
MVPNRRIASRLLTNADVSARINELTAAIAAGVVEASIRKRSWRVQQLQEWADDMLALRAARKLLYAGQLAEGQIRTVKNQAEEDQAILEGFREDADIKQPERASDNDRYPRKLLHPGHPTGGETGMLVKDYRGKNADQEIFKFDSALVDKFCSTLKQAAIEEGQWTEKRELSGAVGMSVIKQRLNAGRQRVADAKKAADAEKGKA